MKKYTFTFFLLCLVSISLSAQGTVFHIDSFLEPFVDRRLIERTEGVELRLTQPRREEVVFSFDKPWEGSVSAYCTVLFDGKQYRLYYRGFMMDDVGDQQVTCMAVSDDGIHFTRPNVGLFEFLGSKENNIVWVGRESHNLTPFLDENPNAGPDERFKALGGQPPMAMASPDGIHWKKLGEEPVLTEGAFDSQNVVFWEQRTKQYRSYSRSWTKIGDENFRTIQTSVSKDFRFWGPPLQNRYSKDAPNEHFYTNATVLHPGAPHIYLSFPMRFIPQRKKVEAHAHDGVSDAVFMTSRDGLHWDRTFLEAWLRPGPDIRNWTERSTMPAFGIVQLDETEYSLYVSEHYRWDTARLRRLSVRKDGFASLHAGNRGGVVITKPFTFSGSELVLNYSTSAAGSLTVEILDVREKPIPEWSGENAVPLFGDALAEAVQWKSETPLTSLFAKPVRLRFTLRDADLYAMKFQ